MLRARLVEVKREKVDQEQYVLEAIRCEVPHPCRRMLAGACALLGPAEEHASPWYYREC
jgi:hypothetical protein